MDRPKLLIPVQFPDPELYPYPDTIVEGLAGFEIVLLGYYEVPEGSDPVRVRSEHETEAEGALYDMAAAFSKAGAPTDVELHFGHADDERGIRDRIAERTDLDGVFVPNPISTLGKVLVPLRDARNAERVVEFVGTLDEYTILDIELLHVVPDEAGVEDGRAMLRNVRDRLVDRGFPAAEVEVTVEVDADPAFSIGNRARRHDLVVMGETEQLDLEERIFGRTYETVADRTDVPIIVLRNPGS